MLDLLQPAEDQISDSGVTENSVSPGAPSAAIPMRMANNYPVNVPPTVNGYSTATGLPFPHTAPQLSTAPSWMFRTPALFSQASLQAAGSFQFSNPTHSSPMIQMTAPGCQGTVSQSWQPSTSLNISWATSTNTSSTVETPNPFTTSSVGNHSRDVLLDRLRGIKTANNQSRRSKRKSSDRSQEVPGKVFVNEERMAARMQGLTLDNNNLDWHPNLETEPSTTQNNWFVQDVGVDRVSPSVSDSDDTDDTSDETASNDENTRDDNGRRLPQLELSEMLEIGMKTKELLPKAILEEINKPNLQVVLWKPPGDFVRERIRVSQPTPMSESASMDDGPSPDVILPTPVQPPQRKIAIVNPTVWAVPAGSSSVASCDDDLDGMSTTSSEMTGARSMNNSPDVQKLPAGGVGNNGEQMEL